MSSLISGCAPFSPARPLAGTWRGTMTSGGVAVPARWDLRADGAQFLTLVLPRGEIAAQGTWAAQGSRLTQWTTARTRSIGGECQTTLLANPIRTTFSYQLTGDQLTLTLPEAGPPIALARERTKL